MNIGNVFNFHLLKPQKLFHKKSSDEISVIKDNGSEFEMQVQGSSGYPGDSRTATGYAANIENTTSGDKQVTGPHESTREFAEAEGDPLLLDDHSKFPDGGLKAWLVVFGSFIGLIPVFGLVNSIGAIESYISINQLAGVSSSVISWIFSLYLCTTFTSCILAGGYFDRNGSRDPMIFGMIMFTGGLIATANCTTVWQFILAFSVVVGFASGILMIPLVSVVATFFIKKRAIATSIATTGGSIGGIVFPILLRKLYTKVGFQWALRILALICAVCLIFATVMVKEREKPETEPFKNKKEMIKWYYDSSLNWRYFLEPKYLFATLGASLAESSLTASSTFIASYALVQGNTQTVSYTLITTTNAVGVLGRYIPGYIADRYMGRFNVMIITVFMAALFNFTMWLPFGSSTPVLWAYSMLYGFSTGSILSLTPVCIGQISKTTDFGKRYSTAYFQQALITLPVMPICGALIGDRSIEGFNHFIIFVSVLMLCGSICYVISRYLSVGAKLVKF
ncbi:Mch4 [Kluyveromyces lactis]|nr:Mch4 [Kluyveromyces lactis]